MNLITSDIKTIFSGAFADHFDTFAREKTERWAVIFKEPIKTIINSNDQVIAGYGNLKEDSYTLTPVSGVYPAIIIYEYKTDSSDIFSNETKTRVSKNSVRIKMEKDGADFILNGKTENVIIDGQTYNDVSQYKVQDFLGLKYYYFNLSQTF